LEQRGVESHWLTSMDYAVREEEKLIADRRTTIASLETTRGLIESTPVVDCSKEGKKEIGSVPGGWEVGIETGYGDLRIPKKPYLSLEDGGNLRLGVVNHKRTAEVATMLLALAREFYLEGLPGLKIGTPHHQRWMTVAEVFGYDYSVFSRDGSIDVGATEEVGIPGTGDPGANFPWGVNLAAGYDATDINYSHKSEFDGFSLGFGQKSAYTGWASTLGLGLTYSRLETSDTLTGTVPGYPIYFGYDTQIETRNFGVFVTGDAEIAIDDFWDTALRYAGEFSGFTRLRQPLPRRVHFRRSAHRHRQGRHDVQLSTRRRVEIYAAGSASAGAVHRRSLRRIRHPPGRQPLRPTRRTIADRIRTGEDVPGYLRDESEVLRGPSPRQGHPIDQNQIVMLDAAVIGAIGHDP
jgi:hypothetical protein